MRKIATVLLIAAAALACHGRTASVQRNQQQYDVVPEGQAPASSTINAPGEMAPPSTTATNVDTTTNFTLPTATTTAPPPNMPGGTIAGALPPVTSTYPTTTYPMSPRPVRRLPPPPPPPPPTETTSTTSTTDTSATETTDTSAPPPTTTDTIGGPPLSPRA